MSRIYLPLVYSLINFYMKERSSIHWLTPQMLATARTGPDQTQELRTQCSWMLGSPVVWTIICCRPMDTLTERWIRNWAGTQYGLLALQVESCSFDQPLRLCPTSKAKILAGYLVSGPIRDRLNRTIPRTWKLCLGEKSVLRDDPCVDMAQVLVPT